MGGGGTAAACWLEGRALVGSMPATGIDAHACAYWGHHAGSTLVLKDTHKAPAAVLPLLQREVAVLANLASMDEGDAAAASG